VAWAGSLGGQPIYGGPVQPDWGDVPAWFEAVGTVGAFAFAFRTYYGDRRRARGESESAQARQIAVWADGGRLWFSNSSGLPVFGVAVTVRWAGGSEGEVAVGVLPSTTRPEAVLDESLAGRARTWCWTSYRHCLS
jgi:hypothetical protein